MTNKRILAGLILFPFALLAEESGKVVVVERADEQPKPVQALPVDDFQRAPGGEASVVVVAEGSILEAAHAVVAQLPDHILNLDLLGEKEMASLTSSTNRFNTAGKRIPWNKAMEEILRPLSLRFFEDGVVVKIGSQEKVDVLYSLQETDKMAGNHTRIEVNFAGGTPISAALRVIQRLAGVNMNFDYMKAEHRGVVAAPVTEEKPEKDGKTVTVQAPPPEVLTTYAVPAGQKIEWRVVLKEVLDPMGYTFIEDNGTVKPMPVELLAKFNQAKINAKPLVTKIISVHYANAETIVGKLKKMNLLKHEKAFMDTSYGKDSDKAGKDDNAKIYKATSGGQLESGSSGDKVGMKTSSGGSAVFDQLIRPRTPQAIIVADVAENISEVEKQIKILDTRDRQVLIEALILEVSDNMKKELGVKWGDLKASYNSQSLSGANDLTAFPKMNADGTVAARKDPVTGKDMYDATTGKPVVDYVWRVAQDGATMVNLDDWAGKVVANRFGVAPISFDAVIKMIQADQYSRSLGSPIITVGDHGEAVIQISTIIPVEQSQINYTGNASGNVGSIGNTTEWLSLQIGTTLWVSPEISEDAKFVRLSVHPQITTADQDNPIISSTKQLNYVVSSQELDTRVNVPSGQVLMLGGLTKSSQHDEISKVPWLGDIPLLGWLFRYKLAARGQTHLVILIRPTVLDEDQPNTGFEGPSMKVADPLMNGVGRTLPPNKGEDPIVAKEHALLEKMGWSKKDEEKTATSPQDAAPAKPLAEVPAEMINHGSTPAESPAK